MIERSLNYQNQSKLSKANLNHAIRKTGKFQKISHDPLLKQQISDVPQNQIASLDSMEEYLNMMEID